MTGASTDGPTVERFREDAVRFIDDAIANDIACEAFGAILPPALFERARRWQRHCFANGFAGVHWPAEFGGRGLSADHHDVWSLECARRGVASYMNFQGFILAGGALLRYGNEDQKARFLRDTLAADITWCQLFSEPDAGSDLASLTTRAVPTADGWVVSGQKVWSSTAQFAQWAILLVRTDPDTPGHRGISFFLFDMTGPGVEVHPVKQMTGDSEFCEVLLDNAPVSGDLLLGALNDGWAVAMSVLADERAGAASAGAALDREIDRIVTAIGSDSTTASDRLMHLNARAHALGQLLLRSGADPRLGPLSKLGRTELGFSIAEFEIDASGPAGMIEGPSTEPFLYAPGMRVAGGTSEIQRNLIGERLLGLPRAPRITTAD